MSKRTFTKKKKVPGPGFGGGSFMRTRSQYLGGGRSHDLRLARERHTNSIVFSLAASRLPPRGLTAGCGWGPGELPFQAIYLHLLAP